MELRTYWDILWRRKWVIAITLATTAAVVFIVTMMMTPVYQASTVIRVRMMCGSTTSSADYYYADRLINTYAQVATSQPVLDELAEKLAFKVRPEITALPVANSELIRVTVQHPNPRLVAEAANTLAEILIARSNELYTGGGRTASQILGDQAGQLEHELEQMQAEYEQLVARAPENTQPIDEMSRSIGVKQGLYSTLLQQYETARTTEAVRSNALSIIDPASTPTRPIKPNKALNLALGGAIGVVGGVCLAFVLDLLDTRLHTVEQIEGATDLPVLGKIPYTRKAPHTVFTDGSSPQREAYRQLRTSICAVARRGTLRRLLVTSALPYEGKSTVVTNLAVAFAQAGHKILAVDADLRRPTLHANFRLPNEVGLSSILSDELELSDAVQATTIPGVSVLTSGPPSAHPAEMLASLRMQSLLDEMPESFDLILVDAPAFVPLTDAAVIAPTVDGVLLVVRRAQAEKQAVQATCRELVEVGAKLIGLVATRTSDSRCYTRYYHYCPPADQAVAGDPLTQIVGLNPLHEKALKSAGIVRFTQLAEQDPEALAQSIGLATISADRIREDQWIEQAQAIAGSPEGATRGDGS